MSKKIKGIAISAGSALIILIAAIFGINLSDDKSDSTPDQSSAISSSISATTTKASENHSVSTTTTVVSTQKPRKTTFTTNGKSEKTTTAATTVLKTTDESYVEYHFRNTKLRDDHFSKHGMEFKVDFGYETAEEYERGASDVINDPNALFKTEAEDGDGIYYLEDTNEFVVLSTDGYIRTYFRPSGRKAYFDRQ